MEIEGIRIKSRWHELHVRLWLGMRDRIRKCGRRSKGSGYIKRSVLKELIRKGIVRETNGLMPAYTCFACEVVGHTLWDYNDSACRKCPVKWSGNTCVSGEFADFVGLYANGWIPPKDCIDMADTIARLPWRKRNEIKTECPW